ncbi:MAG: hypothetical protein DRP83_01355 [Planctomycetota bacterium]|nr:MAG: hypothetical protein DRP83_01355 [Planctomycetota bacterium]
MRKFRGSSRKVLREGSGELIRQQVRSATDEKEKKAGLLSVENQKYIEPELLEKQAFLARMLSVPAAVGVGIGNVARSLNPKSPMTLKKAIPTARRYFRHVDPRMREWVSRNIGSRAARLADKPMQGLDKAINTTLGKNVPVSVRKRIMEEAAEHPMSLLGAPAGAALPVPGASEVGMAGAWAVSKAGKKLLGIPSSATPAMEVLDDLYRQKGFKGVSDYLAKTQARKMPVSAAVEQMTDVVRQTGFVPAGSLQ